VIAPTRAAADAAGSLCTGSLPKVAIICGGGGFPLAVAAAAQRAGRDVLLIGLVGAADQAIAAYPHVWLRPGELGKLLQTLKSHAIGDLALIGSIVRPRTLSDLRPDFGALARLPEIARLFIGGDNHALKGVLRLLEKEGLRVLGAHQLAPDLLAPPGQLTPLAPSTRALDDLAFGRACLAALSEFDVGQALVVDRRRILAIEAAEGTDAMLQRVADMRAWGKLRAKGRLGMLVKAPKKDQDLRVDLPAIGPETIAGAERAQLAGIAVEAHTVLMLERAQLIAQASAADLFLLGFEKH
jgi:UDP-2,3-diacylglucosamine hydrolase